MTGRGHADRPLDNRFGAAGIRHNVKASPRGADSGVRWGARVAMRTGG